MKKILGKITIFVIFVGIISVSLFISALESASLTSELVPLRDSVERAGGTAEWDSENSRILIMYDGNAFIFTIGNRHAYLNGNPFSLEYNIEVNNDRAYISIVDATRLFTPLATVSADEAEYNEYDITIETAITLVEQVREQLAIPGVTVAIVDAQTGFTWTGGFGYADTATGREVDAYTLFPIASISKPFTAVAVMQLVEQGQLDLDAPITNYIPEFFQLPNLKTGGNSDEVTARMLLTNTSGVSSNWMYGFSTIEGHYQGAMNNILDFLATSHMDAPANTSFIYANAGWTLLGVLVARIMGYENYFEGFVLHTNESIFSRIGMIHSSFEMTSDMVPHLSAFYNSEGNQDPVHFTNALGAGGAVSNAHDMAIFMHAMLNGGVYSKASLLNQASVNEMLAPHNFDFNLSPMGYGLGFMHRTGLDGFQSIGHGGNLTHHHSEMVFNYEAGIGVFVSTNSASGILGVGAISNVLLQTAILEKTGDIPLLTALTDENATSIEIAQESLVRYEGLYLLATEQWVISAVEDKLLLNVLGLGDTTLELIPMSDGSFNSVIGRIWFEDLYGEMIIRLGNAKVVFGGMRTDINAHMSNDSFLPWVGTYYPVLPKNHRSPIVNKRLFVNELGMAVMQVYNANGINSTMPLQNNGNAWSVGTMPITFDKNDDSVSFELMGLRFVRQ